jgi:hypothetical protein
VVLKSQLPASSLLVASSALLLTTSEAVAADSTFGQHADNPALILAAVVIAGALGLRHHVMKSMWAGRERAFLRRTAHAQRQTRARHVR